jgi:hypothetical protein
MGSTVLGISREAWGSSEPKFRDGFALPPEGVGITWIIVGHKMGRTQKDDKEFLQFICEMTDEEGNTVKHWQYFDIESRDGLGELRAFIEGIGRSDFSPEDNDIEDLYDTQFICDFKHRKYKDKATGEERTAGALQWKTLMPLNWEDGQPVGAAEKKGKKSTKAEAPAEARRPQARKEEEDDDETPEEDETPAGRRQRRIVTAKAAPAQDVEDAGEDEEDEAPPVPAFKPRRRGLADKD